VFLVVGGDEHRVYTPSFQIWILVRSPKRSPTAAVQVDLNAKNPVKISGVVQMWCGVLLSHPSLPSTLRQTGVEQTERKE